MKSKIINIFWGSVFFLVGGLLLAQMAGIVRLGPIPYEGRVIAFGAASAAFLATYFLSGIRKWGWLFPALICAVMSWHSLSASRLLDLIRMDWPMWIALAIPFYVGFAVNRRHPVLLLPAYVLSAVAFMTFSDKFFMNIHQAGGPYNNVLLIVITGANPLLLVAIPFYALAFWSKKNWWALLPAGGLTSIAASSVLSILVQDGKDALTGVPLAVLFLGFALTLGILWLRRFSQPTGWAKFPAIGFLLLGIAALWIGREWQDLSQNSSTLIFAAGSAVFIVAYFVHGVRKWGWLFPALGCASLSLMLWMEQIGVEDPFLILPLLSSLILSFIAGFVVTRRRGLIIPAAFLTAFMIFLVVPDLVQEEWMGVLFFGLIALASFAAYFLVKRPWWMLLPVGVSASLGLMLLVDALVPHQEYASLPHTLSWDVFSWVLFLGLGATFGTVWMHRRTAPTGWAIYPSGCLLALGLLSLLEGKYFQEAWLVTMTLLVGATFLLAVFAHKKHRAGPSRTGIEG